MHLVVALLGCVPAPSVPAESAAVGDLESGDSVAETPDSATADSVASDSSTVTEPPTLEVRFLAVGGFHLKSGGDALITAPMFSNPDLWTVLAGEIASDPSVVDRYLGDVGDARAVLVGHAHYDHLLDVPYVRNLTDDATVYGNTSVRNILAGSFPEADGCEARDVPEWGTVPPDRVVAVDDLYDDLTDYRSCAGVETCTAHIDGAEGEWIAVEQTAIRIRALCSEHPDQFLFVHFADGCVEDPVCSPPLSAPEWKEGTTLAWIVDFLGDDGAPVFRVYYQDAPTNGPLGHPPAELLAEKAVDLAILNTGNYDQVVNHPGEILRALQPRYTLMGHWEDFFRTLDQEVWPIPFQDMDDVRARLEAEMPGQEGVRWWIPYPGESFTFPAG